MLKRPLSRLAPLGLVAAFVMSLAAPALASAAQAQTLSITPCSDASACSPASTSFPAGGSPSVAIQGTIDTSQSGSPESIVVYAAPGVLANATAAPQCLTGTAQQTPTCQIGQGVVTSTLGPVPFKAYMVPPTTAGDLAGVDLVTTSPPATVHAELSAVQLTSGAAAGQVVVRLSADLSPLGSLTSLVTGLTVDLNGTLDGKPLTRMPTACTPAAPSSLTIVYGTGASAQAETTNASPDVAPPALTGCGSLAYGPTLSATAVKDPTDAGVALTTKLDQPAGQAATKSVVLSVPSAVLTPNTGLLAIACSASDPATCPTTSDIGTVSATSPLLPGSFSGKVVVVKGSGLLPNLAIVFTSPAKIEMTGTVSISATALTADFASVPDLPLSDLTVSFPGGPNAAFKATCLATGGSIGGTLTGQNGKTANVTAPFSVSGCPTIGLPTISGGSLSGFLKGKPKIRFTLTAGKNAPNIAAFAVSLPKGVSIVAKKLKQGLKLAGAKVKSAAVKHGKLVVTLKSPAASVRVTISGKAVKVSKSVIKTLRHHPKPVTLKVTVTDASGKSTTLPLLIKKVS
jgi:hypothetical protein